MMHRIMGLGGIGRAIRSASVPACRIAGILPAFGVGGFARLFSPRPHVHPAKLPLAIPQCRRHCAEVSSRHRFHRVLRLVLLAVSAAGGWFFGRWLLDSGAWHRNAHVFPAGSPKGMWMERVKRAAPDDFPRLMEEEWETVFPEDDPFSEDRRSNVRRWMYGVWLVRDTEGFLKAAAHLDYSNAAAEALVRLKPEKAAEWLFDPNREKSDDIFAFRAVQELAKRNPTLYLKLDPHGSMDVTPGLGSWDSEWHIAVANLAKIDPVAAGKACLAWDPEKNDPNSIGRAFVAVAEAWKTSGPPFKEWVNRIEDPGLRNVASHARICALAEKDARAAVVELYSTKLEPINGLEREAPQEVLMQLAKADLVEALKLMKDVERIFSEYKRDPSAEPSSEEKARRKANPFNELSPEHYSSREDEVENNGVRHAVIAGAVEKFPDDPARLFATLRKLRTDMGGDNPWQRRVESDLVCQKARHWSADACMTAAKLWAAEPDRDRDDLPMSGLAGRAAHVDPDRVLAVLKQLPDSARPSFAGEIIGELPGLDRGQSLALLGQLTAAQWDVQLGEVLGRNPADYAPVIASLPAALILGARNSFMKQWGELDPEAAARWLVSLPADAASITSAAGLAAAWASYDKPAAAAWAATLHPGAVLDGAALSLAEFLADHQPDEAWQWASKVSDPKTRAEAFFKIVICWRSKAPEKFRTDYEAARRAAGLPVLHNGIDFFK